MSESERKPVDERAVDEEVLPGATIVGLRQLLDARAFASQTGCGEWDFAVEISELKDVGVSLSELRLLVQKGYVQHGIELSSADDQQRRFATKGGLVFGDRTCFVLTDAGEETTRELWAKLQSNRDESAVSFLPKAKRRSGGESTPVWNPQLRELRWAGTLVKEFRWHAANQERILSAFEEEGWPAVILDPLPPRNDQDSKRRLHDTIKCLNRNHVNEIIRFHGDGTGEGVIWKSTLGFSDCHLV